MDFVQQGKDKGHRRSFLGERTIIAPQIGEGGEDKTISQNNFVIVGRNMIVNTFLSYLYIDIRENLGVLIVRNLAKTSTCTCFLPLI